MRRHIVDTLLVQELQQPAGHHIGDTLLVQELQQPAGHRRVTFTQAFPT